MSGARQERRRKGRRRREKVVVGWPTGGSVHSAFCDSILGLQAFEMTQGVPAYELAQLSSRSGLYVQENRNNLVKALLQTDADWLLQLDGDESFPPYLLRQLMNLADADERPMVVGLYTNLGGPAEAGGTQVINCIYKEAEDGRYIAVNPPENLRPFEVAAAGSGVLLCHRRVFETLEYPWFWVELFSDGNGGGVQMMNEDLSFCRAARIAGFPIWCEPKAEVVHWKAMPLLPSTMRDFLESADQVLSDMGEAAAAAAEE